MMKPKTVSAKSFNFDYGPRIKRLWNHETETGIGFNQLKSAPFGINDITYIFVRNDGWAIACTPAGFDSCYKLWPDEWREIVVKQNN